VIEALLSPDAWRQGDGDHGLWPKKFVAGFLGVASVVIHKFAYWFWPKAMVTVAKGIALVPQLAIEVTSKTFFA